MFSTIKRKKVLIFSGGSYNGLQIYFALKDSVVFEPVPASSRYDYATFLLNADDSLPFINDGNFVEKLNEYIELNDIEFIIPTHDSIALKLMECQKQINAIICCSEYETAYLCRFKSKTYEKLKVFNFVPKIYEKGNVQYPAFVKDDEGQGGKLSYLVKNIEELKSILTEHSKTKFVICEYLPGDEITVDCFTDRHGNLLYHKARLRAETLNGISSHSYFIEMNDEISYIAKTINDNIKFRGYWFFQCKKDMKGNYKLMEICTRLAGSFSMSKNLDVNMPLLMLYDFMGQDVDIMPNNYNIESQKTYIDRYKIDCDFKRVYLDFDDTLVEERKYYKPDVFAFLLQCLNKKIEVVLLTKHKYDIFDTLNNMYIDKRLFSNIIMVENGREKYEYMDMDKPSIMIDNSYRERKLAKEKLGINTFDVTNIECLIDWQKR